MRQLVEVVVVVLLPCVVLAARLDTGGITYEPTEGGFTVSFQGEVVGHIAGLGGGW